MRKNKKETQDEMEKQPVRFSICGYLSDQCAWSLISSKSWDKREELESMFHFFYFIMSMNYSKINF